MQLPDAIPVRSRIEYVTLGELSTADVVGGDTETLTAAGERALSTVVKEPKLSTSMKASRQFAREADLLTPEVRGVIDDVAEAGGDAAMAMLGETVFALGTGLSDAGYDAAIVPSTRPARPSTPSAELPRAEMRTVSLIRADP